jgi:hypothetical protein
MKKYSSHDYRINTDDAIVIDKNQTKIIANDSKVIFKDKFNNVQEVEVSRLIQVFNNNIWNNRRSVK